MLDTQGNFFLGRLFDAAKGKLADKALLYDPADLTTHGLVTGMTGSGKTGLCVGILEEAALQNIPAIIIDPKGDLTNLLLHFPDLLPADFQPWLDADVVRRDGKTLESAAKETAENWKKGLADWGIDRERLLALKNAAEFAVYTPGSDAGIPVSVLSSLAAPTIPWEENREILRERISSTVTALLGLVGMDNVDPLRSREHILLSNLFEDAWSEGRDLDMTELILQTQKPPFEKLGAFPLENFFPERDRMELAMLLNNILASPGFEVWREGQNLDIPALLFAEDGRPRHSVFYIAHLSDSERMFFVTLLLSAVETWMRTQAGSNTLRALVYMDEIFGYMPPTANPPSKLTLLRMLKQARAFGVGMLLATQNPVDVDYKGMSNTGTWIIGKLQTEQDKNRLLDGLESAAGGSDRATLDKLISALGKRVFVMHNVHEKAPVVFQTRFAMNYLAGPLTRTQIPALNRLVGAEQTADSRPPTAKPAASHADLATASVSTAAAAPRPSVAARPASTLGGSVTRPPVPSSVAEYFLPLTNSLPEAFRATGKTQPADARQVGVFYRPALVASAQVRFFDRKYGVDAEVVRSALIENPERRSAQRWDDFVAAVPADKMDSTPAPDARFDVLSPTLSDAKLVSALQKDFIDWVYRTTSVKARANELLKVYGGPDISQADFMKACSEAASEARDKELQKEAGKIDKQIASLQDKLVREERELDQDQADLQNRKIEAGANLLELGAGLVGFGRKKSVSTQFTKQRLAANAKADVEESLNAIAEYKKQLAALEAERTRIADKVNARWGDVVNKITEIDVNPKKTDIYVNVFGVAWTPYYLVEVGGQKMELPAFGE
ncbi:MAG: helicase HerA domain-containing protein [Chloroflexota bacterium]